MYTRFERFLRYTVVGIISTVAHFLCLYLLVDALAILKPVQASVIAFLCGATVGFVCNRMFVFKNSEAGFEALSKYFLLVGFSGVNNTLIMSLLIKGLAWNYLVAQLFATSCVFVINFAFCKFWIFKEPSYAK